MIRLTDRQMHKVKQAAQIVPLDLRGLYLERLAAKLNGHDLGDGLVHKLAYEVARGIVRDAGRNT